MPFRMRQRFHAAVPSPVIEREEVTLPTGEVETQFTDQSDKLLPDPELFDLKNQLNAGIEPEEVNSKVMSAKTIDADTVVRKYTKKSTTSEVTNNEG